MIEQVSKKNRPHEISNIDKDGCIRIILSQEHEKFKEDVRKSFDGLNVKVEAGFSRLSAEELPMQILIFLSQWALNGISWDLFKIAINRIYNKFKNVKIAVRDDKAIMFTIHADNSVNVIVTPDRLHEFEFIKTLDDLISHLRRNGADEKWQTKKLGEICDVLDNKRKPITKRDRIAGDYPYYGATGILDYVQGYLFDEKLILIGEDGAKWDSGENTSFIVTGKCWVNNHAHVIRPHRSNVIDEWITYFLNFNDLTKYVTGLTVPKLNQANLRNIGIPLPPLLEQKRIVAILDEVFEGIAKAKQNTEKNLKNAREVFEASLNTIFSQSAAGWKVQNLGNIAEFRNGMNFTKSSNGEVLKIVGVRNFQKNFWIPIDDLDEVRVDGKLNEIDQLKGNDLLVVRSNGNPELIGRCMLAPHIGSKICHSGFTIRIRTNSPEVSSEYLCHYLKSGKAKRLLIESGSGINIKSLNQVTLSELDIPIAPLPEQKIIISKLNDLSEQTKKLEQIYQRKLELLEELKQSVLKKAFAGEL